MHKITFKIEGGEDVTIFAAGGENLLALARSANIAIDAPCSGNGSCGKCRVKLLEGYAGGEETRHIGAEEAAEGWRLACALTVCDDAEFLVPDIASAYKNRMRVADLSSPAEIAAFQALQQNLADAGFSRDCGIVAKGFTLSPPTLDDTMPDNERLCRAVTAALGVSSVSLPYTVLKTLPDILRGNDFDITCIARVSGDAAELLDICARNAAPVCGLAIDIGTTTVSGLLVDLATGDILAKANAGNGQIRYGADVINRIIEQRKPGGAFMLQRAIVAETLVPLIDGLCADAKVARGSIYRATIAANTTMTHLLLGINADYLRTEPYIPAFFTLEPFDPSLIGVELAPTSKMSVAPSIGSYVGGDITAGALACMMWDRPELSILIDLGTNGEIVFGNSEFLMACACSAGPAFEGGDISCGMRASDGAIEACTIDAGTMALAYTVIGGGKPVGLCGSGLIDVIAELFRTGIINGKGKFVREGEPVRRDEYGTGRFILVPSSDSATGRDIALSEVDIDNFIRAKGAVFSALMSLITPLGFTLDEVDHVMIAGGIGSGININNAIRVGLLPDLSEEKYSYIGNSSLSGAYAALVSEDAAARLREIAKSMTYVELSSQPGYMDTFIAACFLPHTDATLFPSLNMT